MGKNGSRTLYEKSKRSVSIEGDVSIPGASNIRDFTVRIVSDRGYGLKDFYVDKDGSYGGNVRLKGGVTAMLLDANGNAPNFTRPDGIPADVPSLPTTSLVLRPKKKDSYRVDFSFPDLPDPITGLPLPGAASTPGALKEDMGVLIYNSPREGLIGESGETDWYRVGIPAGKSYYFYANTSNGTYPSIVSLFNSAGEKIFGPYLGYSAVVEEAGTYFVSVEQGGSSLPLGYTLTYN
jgi:hypothetical protein